jgi:ankyrin repeat protein
LGGSAVSLETGMKTHLLLLLGTLFLSFSARAAYVGIHGAAAAGDTNKLAEYLLKDPASISARNGPHRTPLCIAAMTGQTNAVAFLVAHGADVNDAGFMKMTPLADLAMYGTTNDHQCAEVATILLTHGAEVDPVDSSGLTPLMHAVEFRKTQLARVLLEHGARQNLTYKGAFSETPLHMAIRRNDNELVAVLLRFNPPLTVADNNGATPLSLAEQSSKTDIAAMIRQVSPKSEASQTKIYTVPPTSEAMRLIGERIAGGDQNALKELSVLANQLYSEISDYEKERVRVLLLLGRMSTTYRWLGDEAGKGNDQALAALEQSLADRRLASFAPVGLGRAAAKGSQAALEILFRFAKSDLDSAVHSLCLPAEANVQPAVDYIAEWLAHLEPSEREGGTAMEATNALGRASAQGNVKAQAALEKFRENGRSQ